MTADELIEQVARANGAKPEEVMGPSRQRCVVDARWAVWRALKAEGWSANRIAAHFARDPVTVMYALDAEWRAHRSRYHRARNEPVPVVHAERCPHCGVRYVRISLHLGRCAKKPAEERTA